MRNLSDSMLAINDYEIYEEMNNDYFNIDIDGLVYYTNSDGHEISIEYDEGGRPIYCKRSEGEIITEKWWEYDTNGKLMHYIDSSGEEFHLKHDERGNMIYSKNSKDLEKWFTYDENNNRIHFRDSDGESESYEYDKDNNLIYSKDYLGNENRYEYDSNGKLRRRRIYSFYVGNATEQWEYDNRGNNIYYANSSGFAKWNKYNEDGKLTLVEFYDGSSINYEFDDKGRVIYKSYTNKSKKKLEIWNDYDENGKLSHTKNSVGYEEWFTFNK